MSNKENSNISKDIWFGSVGDTLPNGETTYFICEYKDKYHYDEVIKDFILFCNHKQQPILNIEEECNLNCDMYGRCRTCNGFSAVRCSECFIPRP